jgi:hypothetical protein
MFLTLLLKGLRSNLIHPFKWQRRRKLQKRMKGRVKEEDKEDMILTSLFDEFQWQFMSDFSVKTAFYNFLSQRLG